MRRTNTKYARTYNATPTTNMSKYAQNPFNPNTAFVSVAALRARCCMAYAAVPKNSRSVSDTLKQKKNPAMHARNTAIQLRLNQPNSSHSKWYMREPGSSSMRRYGKKEYNDTYRARRKGKSERLFSTGANISMASSNCVANLLMKVTTAWTISITRHPRGTSPDRPGTSSVWDGRSAAPRPRPPPCCRVSR